MNEEFWKFNNRANIHFDIIHRLGSLLLMFTATKNKIEEFQNEIPYYNKNDSHSTNKHRMKETGRMFNGYRQKLNELIIIGISKSTEDLLFDIEDKLNNKISFWKDCNGFDYYKEMKTLRNLNNCIKHSNGIIKRGGSSSNYLIENDGFKENSKIDYLELDLNKFIFQSFIFQMEIFWDNDERDNPYKQIKDDSEEIRKILIPEFIEKNH